MVNKGKILYQIQCHPNATKLDVRKNTGYSMSTVLKYVDELKEDGLIICGEKSVKSGRTPAQIKIDPEAYVLGVGYYDGKIYGARCDLNGNAKHFLEYESRRSDQAIVEAIKKLKLQRAPAAVGFIGEADSLEWIEKESDTKLSRGDLSYGLSCFYRFYDLKSEVDIAVIYIDDKIRVVKNGEKLTYYEVGSLFSPIMNTTKGRLSYKEVLPKSVVKERLNQRYSADFSDLEAAFDNDLSLYRERLEFAAAELINLIDKLVKPSVTIIGGSYLSDGVISKAASGSPYSKLIFAGNVKDAVGAIAASIALNELYAF